jgi:ferredoxin-fold anticodon binding domain-containing protein
MPAEEMDALVKVIGKICFAKKIYKNESVFLGTMHIDERDYMTVTCDSGISYCKDIEGGNRYGRKWELL